MAGNRGIQQVMLIREVSLEASLAGGILCQECTQARHKPFRLLHEKEVTRFFELDPFRLWH
jgi:hypothetical protein